MSTNHAGEELLDFADETEAGPALQAVLGRVRTHVLQGRGQYVPKGFEEAVTLDLGEGSGRFYRGQPRSTTNRARSPALRSFCRT